MGDLTVFDVRGTMPPEEYANLKIQERRVQIQLVADQVGAAGGGILFFPTGVHTIVPPIRISSNTWVLGAPGAVLKREASGSALLQLWSVSNVRVSGLAFDLNVNTEAVSEERNYQVGINVTVLEEDLFERVSDSITIEDCHFFT